MRKGLSLVIAVALIVVMGVTVFADPAGPTSLTNLTSSRYDLSTEGVALNAYAGNVTELSINATSITQGWQGYYGNILGSIVLGDLNNDTLYDWSITSPGGQIYASRDSSITWSQINCTNATEIDAEDTALSFAASAKDRVNETFSFAETHSAFYVGTVPVAANDCAATTLHNSTSQNNADWTEVLLSDDSGSVVYTALINADKDGFNGSAYDFQMIVGEDGHNGDANTVPYYFWAELQ